MRKSIVLKVTLICFGLTDLMWVAPETGYAQIDQKAIVGIWLFDEGRGKTLSDSSGNGSLGNIAAKRCTFLGPQLWLYRMKYLLTC